jgi:hypothetical protein
VGPHPSGLHCPLLDLDHDNMGLADWYQILDLRFHHLGDWTPATSPGHADPGPVASVAQEMASGGLCMNPPVCELPMGISSHLPQH